MQEGKDIESIFPGITKNEPLNNSIIKGRIKSMDSTIDGAYHSTLGNAYDKMKSGGSSSQKTLKGLDGNTFDASNLTPEEYQQALDDGYTAL